MSTPIVHVIDDDNSLLDAMRMLLANEGFVVRTYVSATDFVFKLDASSSGCIVTDVRMPRMNGLELLSHIAEKGIALPVIVITGHADVPLAVRAMKQGAVDFLEKPFDADRLVEAVRSAIAPIPDAESKRAAPNEAQSQRATLTDREGQVLDRLIRGEPNKIIAYEMGISPRTVEVHRANVMKKTHAKNLAQLVRKFV